VTAAFRCCTCGTSIDSFEEAVEHRKPTPDHNYQSHHVVPTADCLFCMAGCEEVIE
jgi:hypothetical protein